MTHSTGFYQYITWRMNHQQMNSWATVGLVTQLAWAGVIGKTSLHDSISQAYLEELKPVLDSRLARHLEELVKKGYLSKLMAVYQSVLLPYFQNLLTRRATGIICQGDHQGVSPSPGWHHCG
jgi:hypothetical protein